MNPSEHPACTALICSCSFFSFLSQFQLADKSGLDTGVRGHDRWLASREVLGPSNSPLFLTCSPLVQVADSTVYLNNSRRNYTLKQCVPSMMPLLHTHCGITPSHFTHSLSLFTATPYHQIHIPTTSNHAAAEYRKITFLLLSHLWCPSPITVQQSRLCACA